MYSTCFTFKCSEHSDATKHRRHNDVFSWFFLESVIHSFGFCFWQRYRIWCWVISGTWVFLLEQWAMSIRLLVGFSFSYVCSVFGCNGMEWHVTFFWLWFSVSVVWELMDLGFMWDGIYRMCVNYRASGFVFWVHHSLHSHPISTHLL